VTLDPITVPGGNFTGATAEWTTGFRSAADRDAGKHKLHLKATSTGTSAVPLSNTVKVALTVNKVNHLPEVSNVAISPTEPTGADRLTVNYTFSDEDEDEEDGTEIRWYKGDEEQTGLRNFTTVSSKLTTPGEEWKVTVNPSDDGGKTFHYPEEEAPSDKVTISDSPPTLRSPLVTPSEGTVATQFKYSVIYEDRDDQPPVSVVVNISSSEISLPMTKDPADNNFTDGVKYTATISGLKKLPLGESHTYKFVATHSIGELTSPLEPAPPHTGPTINDSPAKVSAVKTSGKTGNITVSYNLTDFDGEPANIRLDYQVIGAPFWITHAVSRSNVAPGVGLSFDVAISRRRRSNKLSYQGCAQWSNRKCRNFQRIYH
jgi:hypothetical protein